MVIIIKEEEEKKSLLLQALQIPKLVSTRTAVILNLRCERLTFYPVFPPSACFRLPRLLRPCGRSLLSRRTSAGNELQVRYCTGQETPLHVPSFWPPLRTK